MHLLILKQTKKNSRSQEGRERIADPDAKSKEMRERYASRV